MLGKRCFDRDENFVVFIGMPRMSARLVTFLGIERYSLWDQSFLIPSFSRTDVHLAITATTTVRLIEKREGG